MAEEEALLGREEKLKAEGFLESEGGGAAGQREGGCGEADQGVLAARARAARREAPAATKETEVGARREGLVAADAAQEQMRGIRSLRGSALGRNLTAHETPTPDCRPNRSRA